MARSSCIRRATISIGSAGRGIFRENTSLVRTFLIPFDDLRYRVG